MQIDKFTIKAQEALRDAHNFASERGQTQIDVLHLALALVLQEGGLVGTILEKLDVNANFLETELEKIIGQKLVAFKESTGISISAIHIGLTNVQTFNEKEANYLLDVVECKIVI